jgi:monoterpene epsilon-lactone hydrolase
MAPEFEFPCALEDAIRGFLYLVRVKGYAPENIHVAGDSAGGGLSIALAFALKDKGLPLPGAIYGISPW